MKKIFVISICLSLAGIVGCAKTLSVAKVTQPQLVKKEYSASANDLYYALRWAFRSSGYPIVEEDFQNGVIKSRYVPVGAKSHYVAVFGKEDYGVTGAYHQLEARLVPHGDKTVLQLGSRIKGIVKNIKSSGKEEKMIIRKVSDYLRHPHPQITNQGVQE